MPDRTIIPPLKVVGFLVRKSVNLDGYQINDAEEEEKEKVTSNE